MKPSLLKVEIMPRRVPASEATVAAFCKAFRAARLACGLTQEDVAEICRCNGALRRSAAYISEIEGGKRHNLTLRTMMDLTAAVGMTLEVRLIAPVQTSKKRKLD